MPERALTSFTVYETHIASQAVVDVTKLVTHRLFNTKNTILVFDTLI